MGLEAWLAACVSFFLCILTHTSFLDLPVGSYDVEFMVQESRLITGGTGFHVGQNEGSADFSLSINNPSGLADRAKWTYSRTSRGAITYDLSYTLPFLGDGLNPLGVHLSKVRGEEGARKG